MRNRTARKSSTGMRSTASLTTTNVAPHHIQTIRRPANARGTDREARTLLAEPTWRCDRSRCGRWEIGTMMTAVPMEVPRSTSRQAVALVATVTAVLASITAGQKTLSVSVANRCEQAIETCVGSLEDGKDLHWKRIDPGESTRVASVKDDTTRVNLLVRAADSPTPAVTVVVADLSKPPLGMDDN